MTFQNEILKKTKKKKKQDLTFYANCLNRDSLHEMSKPVFWEK